MAESSKYVRSHDYNGSVVIEILPSKLNEQQLVDAVRQDVLNAINEAPEPRVILDLQKVEFITSVAVLPFFEFRRLAQELGGRVVLANVNSVVAEVLTVTQLLVEQGTHAQHLKVATDLDSAVDLLQADNGS